MQDEALADLDALAADATDRASVCVHRAELARGRGRHRRLAPQGPLPPAGLRLRAGRRRRAARLGPLDRGFHLRDALDLVTKRQPGALLRFGGHAFAAGLTLREADLRALRRRVRGGRARAARAATTSRDRCETDGAPAPRRAHDRAGAAAARRGLGPGLPAAALRRVVRGRRRSASSARSTRGSRSHATARRSRRSCSGTPTRCRRASTRSTAPRSTSGRGRSRCSS